MKKIKNRIIIGPSSSILGTYPKEDTCTATFTAALLITVRRQKQPRCPLTEVPCTCSGIVFRSMKAIWVQATTRMDLENIVLSEISQAGKDKYSTILLTSGI